MYNFLRGYWHLLLLAFIILMAPVAIQVPVSYSAPVEVREIRFLEIQAAYEKWYRGGEVSDEYIRFVLRDLAFRTTLWA